MIRALIVGLSFAVLVVWARPGAPTPVLPRADELLHACMAEHDLFGGNRVTREHGPGGRIEVERADNRMDGTIDLVRTYTYDESNRLRRMELSYPGQGGPASYETYYHSLDGHRTWRKSVSFLTDEPYVGTRWFTHRDEHGRVLVEQVTTGTPPLSGWRKVWTYDASGHPLARLDERFEWTPDWRVDAVRTFEIDDLGRIVTQYTDTGGTGEVDETTRFDYDEQGRLVGSYTVVHDPDEGYEWTHRRDYDDDRAMMVDTIDWDNDGIPDERSVYYFRCDD